MFNTRPAGTIEFREGDNVVVLADGMLRLHPVVWLQRLYPNSRLLKRAL